VEGQDEGLNAAHGGEAAGAVELERRSVGGFGLNGQAGGAGGRGGLADGLQQRAAGSAAPGAGDHVQVTQLPEAAQHQGGRHGDGRGQAHQVRTAARGEDGQLTGAGVAGQPGQCLGGGGRLAVVLPVLVEQRGHLGQLGRARTGQRRNPEAIHTLTLPAHPPATPSSSLPGTATATVIMKFAASTALPGGPWSHASQATWVSVRAGPVRRTAAGLCTPCANGPRAGRRVLDSGLAVLLTAGYPAPAPSSARSRPTRSRRSSVASSPGSDPALVCPTLMITASAASTVLA